MKRIALFLLFALLHCTIFAQQFCDECLWLLPTNDEFYKMIEYERCVKFNKDAIIRNKVKQKKIFEVTRDSLIVDTNSYSQTNYESNENSFEPKMVVKENITNDTSLVLQHFFDIKGNLTKEIITYMTRHEETLYFYDSINRLIKWKNKNFKINHTSDKGSCYYHNPNMMIKKYNSKNRSVETSFFLPDKILDFSLVTFFNQKGEIIEEYKKEGKFKYLNSKQTFNIDGTSDTIYDIDSNGELNFKIKLVYNAKKNIIEENKFNDKYALYYKTKYIYDSLNRITYSSYWLSDKLLNTASYIYFSSFYIIKKQHFENNKLWYEEEFTNGYDGKLIKFIRKNGNDLDDDYLEIIYDNNGLISKTIQHGLYNETSIYQYEYYE